MEKSINLSFKEKASYGAGAVGKDMVYAFVSGFLMYYYNTVLGISATFIGVLFMAARVFDALNDPLMGIVVEKSHSRFGKFRPWIFSGTILNALVIYAIFAVPNSLSGISLLVYTSVAYILWGMTYTIMDIPYWSMIPAITEAGKDRESISVIARSCAGVGYAIPTALTLIAVKFLGRIEFGGLKNEFPFVVFNLLDDNTPGIERRGFKLFAIVIIIIFICAISITVKNVRERNETVKKESASVSDMIKALVYNDQALVVVVGIVVFNASLYLTQQLAIYFFKYDIGNEDLYGLFGTVGGAAQIIAMMLLPALRVKLGCKKILIGAISTAIFGYVCMFVLGTLGMNNIILLCLAAVIIFFGFGLATVLTTIFLADSVDYGEWKNNQRNESAIFSLQTFVVKLASAISVLIAGVGLDLIKLDKKAEIQSVTTLFGLRVIMLVIPIAGLVFSIGFFAKRYMLTEDKLQEITRELAQRNNQQAGVEEENDNI